MIPTPCVGIFFAPNFVAMISHKQQFLEYLAQTTDDPLSLEIVKSNGIYLIDRNGKRYMDFISGIGVNNTGHRPHRVIQAIRKQLGKYLHTMVYGEYIQQPQVRLARRLCKLLPENLNSVYYVNSGSEAIEGALKLAKRFTKRLKIVAMGSAYHGSTHGALSLMDDQYYSNFYRPLLPEVYFARFNDVGSLDVIDEDTACVVIEPVQGEAGYIPATEEFLKAIRKRCDETGTLLILDEIQTGMGRSGSLFAFEQYGVKPDILCLAKAFGGGMPLGAFISSREVMSSLKKDPILGHITTFGGHPVSCAAADENLRFMVERNVADGVHAKGNKLRAALEKHPAVKEFTGTGLMMRIELADFDQVQTAIKTCLDNGLITDWFLYRTSALRIAPPLTISDQELDRAIKILLKALDSVKPRNPA